MGRLAAELMGVSGVRIFCEDWLVKEPGAAITPWHQDAAVFPFDPVASITCWIPLQDVPSGMGLMRFARGSHRYGLSGHENIDDESEAAFAKLIRARDLPIDELPPMRLGDVSFHDGLLVHGAFPNVSNEPRIVLALHCFADGARMKVSTTPTMAHMHEIFAANLGPGDLAANESWPRIHPVPDRTPAPARGERWHVHATILPDGRGPTDLWIEDGRIRLSPVEGAVPLGDPNGFILPGLVDCHAHISWPHDPASLAHTVAFMNEARARYARTGVTLLRDMGSASDDVLSLGDALGLPRVHAAGLLIVRDDVFPFTNTPPESLRDAFVKRALRGARWVKVFTDWTDDWGGRQRPGFTGDDELTYPVDVLRDAIAAAHALGTRVAAHCFSRAGAEAAVRAGVDSLEHGWGVDDAILGEMCTRGTAWVPLLGIARSMKRVVDPDRVAWIDRSLESLARLLPLARRRGVRVLAGTDWFPEVGVADEVRALHEIGLDVREALGAASWDARAWLGEPGLDDGAPADLVLFRDDPRDDLGVLASPELILIEGERVLPVPPR